MPETAVDIVPDTTRTRRSDAVRRHDAKGPGMVDFLAFHAANRPDHPAVIDGGDTFTYRQFLDDLRRVIGWFRHQEIPSNAYVAVEWDGLYRHWLLLLALESLSVPTFSFAAAANSPVYDVVIGRADLVLHVSPRAASGSGTGPRQIETDADWWQGVLATAPVSTLPDAPPPGRALRIVCSSGTTAAAKVMAQTAGQIDFRQSNCLWHYGLSTRTRHLVGMGFMIQADYLRAIACLRSGGTVIFDDRHSIWQALLDHRPTHMALMPLHLSPILESLDAGPQPKPLHITAYGGRVPPAVRQRLKASIASEFVEQYGTNEFSFVATVDDDGLAAIYPGVAVQIVDDRDRVQPFGTVGRIRVRSPGCVDGYLFDPPDAQEKFRDGWCYPGDIGLLENPYRLRLQGREDDILNIRGIKLYAPEYEAIFSEIDDIVDVALTEYPDRDGIPALYIVLVTRPGANLEDVRDQISGRLTIKLGRFHLVPVTHIPRTDTGKIQRNSLRQGLERLLSRHD